MRNTYNLSQSLMIQNLLHIVTHPLSGIRLVVQRLGALSIAQKLGCENPVPLTGEIVDLMAPVENERREAVQEKDGFVVCAGSGDVDVVVSEAPGGFYLRLGV